jgi:hypothetical protein
VRRRYHWKLVKLNLTPPLEKSMTKEMQFTIARLANSSDRACRVIAQQSPLYTPHAIAISGLAIAINGPLYIDIHVFRSYRNRSTFEISDHCACAMLSSADEQRSRDFRKSRAGSHACYFRRLFACTLIFNNGSLMAEQFQLSSDV